MSYKASAIWLLVSVAAIATSATSAQEAKDPEWEHIRQDINTEHNQALREINREWRRGRDELSQSNSRIRREIQNQWSQKRREIGEQKLSAGDKKAGITEIASDKDALFKEQTQSYADQKNEIDKTRELHRSEQIAAHNVLLERATRELGEQGAGAIPTGSLSRAESERIAPQLQQYARDLREVAVAIKLHASTLNSEELSKEQKTALALDRQELLADAKSTLQPALEADYGQIKARRSALTQQDLNSLVAKSTELSMRSEQRLNRSGLSSTIAEVEAMQETVSDKREMATKAFQNYDEKWNQLYRMLSTVLKNKKDMDAGVTRNML